MSGVIFVIGKDEELIELEETPFEAEAHFQELLAKHPGLLAGDQIDPDSPRRWLLVAREFGIPDQEAGSDRWSVDHLFLDQDAIPTFVEVKRSSDSRIRREVVGQMLDYAANSLAYWPADRLESQFRDSQQAAGMDPNTELEGFLGTDMQPDEFWDLARVNLELGRVRLLFVGDRIPVELRRIVEFLNEQMDRIQVLAIEIRQFAGAGVRTLVPQVIGLTERTRSRSAAPRPRNTPWDRQSFLERLGELGSADIDTTTKILDWAQKRSLAVSGGRGQRMAGLNFNWNDISILGIDEWDGNARFRVNFYVLPPPFDAGPQRDELRSRLNELPGVELPLESQYQGIPLTLVRGTSELEQLLDTLDWLLSSIQSDGKT